MRRLKFAALVVLIGLPWPGSVEAQKAVRVDAAPVAAAGASASQGDEYRPSLLVPDVVLAGAQASTCGHLGRTVQLLLRESFAAQGFRIMVDSSKAADFTLRCEIATVADDSKWDSATVSVEREGELITSASGNVGIWKSCDIAAKTFADLANSVIRNESLAAAVKDLKSRSPAKASVPVPVQKPEVRGPATVILAVFDVQASQPNLKREMLDQLTDYLAARLTQVGGFRVVPREQIRQRLAQEKTASFKACYDQSCQIELGKAVAAEKSLSTKLLRVGTKCALTSQIYDLRSETAETAASVRTDCSDDALMDAMDSLAKQLAAGPGK